MINKFHVTQQNMPEFLYPLVNFNSSTTATLLSNQGNQGSFFWEVYMEKDMSTGNVKGFYETYCFVHASRSCLFFFFVQKRSFVDDLHLESDQLDLIKQSTIPRKSTYQFSIDSNNISLTALSWKYL